MRFVREAVAAVAAIGGGMALFTFFGGVDYLWPVIAGCGIVLAVGVVQLATGRPSPPVLIAASAISLALVAPWVRHDATPALIAAVLLAGVVVFVVFEPPLHALAGIGALVTVMAYASWVVNPRLSGWIGFVPVVAATFVSWSMLTALRRKLVARSDEIRERDRMYRELFDRVSAGLYRTTPDGRFIDANPAFVAMLGYSSKEELLGVPVEDVYVDAADRGALLSFVDRTSGVTVSELHLRRADGIEIWVRDRTLPVLDESGRVVCYDGDLQDITEERRAERELLSQVRSKSELIAAVSHELRTPLTAVLGFLEVLAVDSGVPARERADLVRIALDQATDMSALIEDLLTAARIENDELVMAAEPLNAEGAVMSVVAAVAPRAGIQIGVGDDAVVWADPIRFRQILRNLVTNAVRYGKPPVEVRSETGHDGSVRIVVADSGPGVAVDLTDRIFEAFFRGHDAESRPGSIGLGLAVSRRLARLMGGELSYSRVGDETRFVLEVPVAAPAKQAGVAAS